MGKATPYKCLLYPASSPTSFSFTFGETYPTKEFEETSVKAMLETVEAFALDHG